MFTLLCCADIYGEKINLELTWDHPLRSLADLHTTIEDVFDQERRLVGSHHRRRLSGPDASFSIARVQIYDDEHLCWRDLVSLTQIHEFDQLYVFQPQTQWHSDTQQDLPPPRPPANSRASVAVVGQAITPSYEPSRDVYPRLSPGFVSRPRGVSGSSVTTTRIEEHRKEEESLLDKLRRLRQERDALERQAMQEEESERHRRAEEASRRLQEKEDEIWRHREALRRAEQDFYRLMDEKQQLMALRRD